MGIIPAAHSSKDVSFTHLSRVFEYTCHIVIFLNGNKDFLLLIGEGQALERLCIVKRFFLCEF